MSPQVMNLSHSARLLFIGLITQADDEGRGTSDARRVKASIFGGDDTDSASVRRWLDEIVAQGLIVIYHDEKHGDLYSIPTWKHHQKIDRPGRSGYPSPNDQRALDEDSTSARRGSEGGRDLQEGGREGSSGSEGSSRARELANSAGADTGSGDLHSEASPPEEPSRRRGAAAERRNGDFEDITEAVSKLLTDGGYKPGDYAGLARALHVSKLQAEVAVRQLRDRGRLPAVAA